MNRSILINVDSGSWPQNQSPPSALLKTSHVFNIPLVLLQIGALTTPPYRGGFSLSEYWAFVRYFNALTTSQGLRLTQEYEGLDSHQKTILSDDFGVGFSISYLTSTLNLAWPINGQFFIDNMLGAIGGTYSGKKPKKRGPGKSPDYITYDNQGMWHVIECKGTQSNLKYSIKQVSDGVSQKNTVSFPPNVSGERLVAGMFISSENSAEPSTLTIRDPEAENPFVIPEYALEWAKDSVSRGTLSSALQQAGFPATASVIAAPMGSEVNSRQSKFRRAENLRRERVREKQNNSSRELETALDQTIVDGYVGRSAEFDLPGLQKLTDGKLSKVKISNGISLDAIKKLRKPGEYEERPTLAEQVNIYSEEVRYKSWHDDNIAEISHGDIYKTRLELLK